METDKDIWWMRLWRKSVVLLKRIKLSNDPRVSLWDFLVILIRKLMEPNAHQQASSIAFSFTLSLFPAILFLFSLVPYVTYFANIPNLSAQVLEMLHEALPEGIYAFVKPTIIDIIENPRGDVLSLVFVLAVYASSSGVVELMFTFNSNFQYSEKRSFIYRRLVAIGLAFMFAFLLVTAIGVMVVGELVLHILVQTKNLDTNFLYYLLAFSRYFVSFLLFYFGIAYIYYVAPAVHNKWRLFSYGSMFAALSAIITTRAFSYYLSHFATYNKLYGSIGTIIALMFWFYILAWILLIGFALDSSFYEAKIDNEIEYRRRMQMLEDLEDLG
jgi:membrane protein